jgi:DNA-binding NarL/FixJ family response regulator
LKIRDNQEKLARSPCHHLHMGLTVLIVDDHPTFRRFARRLLEAAGFAVVGEAPDGAAALAAVRELRPDAVLLDVVLPDRSGLDIAEALARRPERPLVVLTSSRDAEDLGAALNDAPVLGFIPKGELSGPAFAALVGGS